jgi:hypothetical protein
MLLSGSKLNAANAVRREHSIAGELTRPLPAAGCILTKCAALQLKKFKTKLTETS